MQYAQKLISTRRGSLYLAAIAALLAGMVILVYLNRYRENLQSGGTPVTVLVARTTIPKGTSGSVVATKRLYTATTIRESQLREGAISDPASLADRVAITEIYEGAQLTASDFSTDATSLASSLTDKERILSIPLDSAHGLIGQVEVGDHVDIYAAFNVVGITTDGRPVNGGAPRAMLKRIISDIPIVQLSKQEGGVGSKPTNVSVRLTDEQAGYLAFASDHGKVWFSLRPAVGAKSTPPKIVTVETLMLGVRPVTMLHALGGRS
jgi:Flp pilus assembly protein CpaB